VVFLVAVPLALGIAFASGAPILSGLIGCAVGGIVAGLFGGAPLQVSGPAAGLTVIVYGMVQKFGWPTTCAITVAAGVFQLIFGFSRIARICLGISPAVVHGMLAGIGVVIALAQMHVLLGGAPESSALRNLLDLPGQILDLHTHAAFLGVMTLVILFAWNHLPAKVRQFPGALAAVLVTTIISNVLWLDVKRIDLPDNILSAFRFPAFPTSDFGPFLMAALTIAMVASVESLLCAVATDKLHKGPRANLDRELVGQGAANLVSGLLGGLPVTGVIVRSSANISAGAKTRASAVLHGVWVIVFVALFASQLERVPLATLAGLLVFVGVRLVNVHHIRELVTHREGIVYFVTLGGVVFLNLLTGVALGIALGTAMLLRRLAVVRVTVENRDNRWHVKIDGSMTFLSVPVVTAKLQQIPPGTAVDIDLMADFMDHAAFEALHTWRKMHEQLGGTVDIDEMHEEWYSSAEAGRPIVRKQTGPRGLRRTRRTETPA
jgi:carbonic anhydrase